MFENMTFDYIIKRAIGNVSNNVDKRQGSVIYDAIAPCCMEMAKMYKALDSVINETFADSASREFLIRRARERGLFPKEASPAVVKGEFNIDVPIGSRFFIDGLVYYASERISNGIYKLTCETNGVDGHRHFGKVLPLENIEGLESAEITDIIITGEDSEDTEDFRKRYFDSFSALAFGGNKKDYIEKINLIPGVGGCKVFPAFYGGGSVKLVIISSDYSEISNEFVSLIKEKVDPYNYSGQGVGIAPIGHKVFVESVASKAVDISVKAEISEDAAFDFVFKKAYSMISDYFIELSKKWAEQDSIEIAAMRIGSDIFNINGVRNVSSVIIGNEKPFMEYKLPENNIPIIGSLFINGVGLEEF